MIYTVTISGTGINAALGFIDSRTVYQFGNETSGNPFPSSYTTSLAKARANHRHRSVVLAVQFYSGMKILSFAPTGGTINAAPTAMVYTVEIDKLSSVTTPDELNEGVVLVGEDAITRIFARSLVRQWTRAIEVLDPTATAARGNNVEYPRNGPKVVIDTIAPLFATLAEAEDAITLTTT